MVSNETRGIFGGGGDPEVEIKYNFIHDASANTVDFGDASSAHFTGSGCSSPTRGVFNFGYVSPGRVNNIEFVTIATTGNSQDFGDLTTPRNGTGALSNSSKGNMGWRRDSSPKQT